MLCEKCRSEVRPYLQVSQPLTLAQVQVGLWNTLGNVGFNLQHKHVSKMNEAAKQLHQCLFQVAAPVSDNDKYLKLLKWFKLFYDFYQEDVKDKPSACASALSENGELQEFVDEANRIR